MSAFELKRVEAATPSKATSPKPASSQGRLRRRLRGVGYAEGRSLLSPQAAAPDPAAPDPIPADPAAAEATPADAPGTAQAPPKKRRVIRQGSRGDEVTYAQGRLNAHGAGDPPLATDGIFGPLTRKATLAYQDMHALATDAVIGPKTWASLDGPVQVGTSGGKGSGSGGGGGPGSVMLYDNTDYTVPPPPAGTKKAAPLKDIAAAQKRTPPDLGTTVKVEGAQAGTDAEVHLYWVIARLGQRSRWGSEVDLVTQVGWTPKGQPGPAPVGRVQLRIDGSGNATAALHGAGAATVANTFKTRADATKGLAASFGIAGVVDGDAVWSVAELNKVHAAFSRLSSGEVAAIRGVVLKRMKRLDEDGKPAAGLFETNHELSKDLKTATSTATLSLADDAFSHDLKNFIGGSANAAPVSFQTILHEVGHAVEEAERYKARKTQFEATADYNRKTEVLETRRLAANQSLTELNAEVTTVMPTINGYRGKTAREASRYVRATDAVNPTIGNLIRASTGAKATRTEATARTALNRRNTARDALKKAAPTNPAPTDLADLETKQDEAFKAGQERAVALRDQEAAGTARTRAVAAVTATETKDGKDTVTKRLKKFKDFVTKEKIPPLTKYASTDTGEFHAEAFSLYRADPGYLRLVAPKLAAWFDRGEHLK